MRLRCTVRGHDAGTRKLISPPRVNAAVPSRRPNSPAAAGTATEPDRPSSRQSGPALYDQINVTGLPVFAAPGRSSADLQTRRGTARGERLVRAQVEPLDLAGLAERRERQPGVHRIPTPDRHRLRLEPGLAPR